jgi:DNA-binding response OmpR family regulator
VKSVALLQCAIVIDQRDASCGRNVNSVATAWCDAHSSIDSLPTSKGVLVAQILVVEDDVSIATLVADHLVRAGHAVDVVHDGLEALASVRRTRVELVVLDVMLPRASGIEVAKAIRELPAPQPIVLMLTARASEEDLVLGYEAGADDYVRKPFGVRELLTRIEALLRLAERREQDLDRTVFVFGALRIDPARRLVMVGSSVVKLTKLEFDLLRYLTSNRDVVVPRERLLTEVWGYQHAGYARTVDSHVMRLRKKLRLAGHEEDVLETVHAAGYRFHSSESR